MKTKKPLIWALLAFLAAPLGVASAASLSDCLARLSRTTVYMGETGSGWQKKQGVFNPAVQLDSSAGIIAALEGRYGMNSTDVYIGETVGERYTPDPIYMVLSSPQTPCPELPSTYVLTEQDRTDVVYVEVPPGSSKAAFDGLFLPLAAKTQPTDPIIETFTFGSGLSGPCDIGACYGNTGTPITVGADIAVAAGTQFWYNDHLYNVVTAPNLTWDFGDGTTASGPTASHAYSAPGHYAVTLKVSGGKLQSAGGAGTFAPAWSKAFWVSGPTTPPNNNPNDSHPPATQAACKGIQVNSNVGTNWIIGGPQTDGKFIYGPNYPAPTTSGLAIHDSSGNPLPIGTYNIQTAADVAGGRDPEIKVNGWRTVKGATATGVCSNKNGGILTFEITYSSSHHHQAKKKGKPRRDVD